VLPDDEQRERLLNRIASCISRCHNGGARHFPHYGGRGIFVHAAWRVDRSLFLRHLLTLEGWDRPEFELDRIDNDGGYAPGNLRFVSRGANVRNRRTVGKLQQRVADLDKEVRDLRSRLRRPEESFRDLL
jgi:hypothetical protein